MLKNNINKYRMKSSNALLLILSSIICFIFINVVAAQASPYIHYISAKSGPNQGWEESTTRGAAITIWTEDIGSSRGNNSLSVAGITLNSDSDFAEWGANTNPSTAKNFRRITFWLNSGMPEGNTEGLYVTVNGVQSNTIPFKIDNTGKIRFISTTGSDSNNGISVSQAWATGERAEDFLTPGDFLYFKGGIYPHKWYIGYKCRHDSPGTDENRITVTSYPGEHSIIGNNSTTSYINIMTNYWTIANMAFNGGYILAGWGQDACVAGEISGAAIGYSPCVKKGNQVIGNEMYGTSNNPLHTWGDNYVIAANYIHPDPIDSTAYPLYLSEGDNVMVTDNEIDGGSGYIHMWDETGSRCTNTRQDFDRVIRNWTFAGNIINMRQHGSYIFHSGLLIGASTASNPETHVENVLIKNNIFFSSDGTSDRSGIEIRTRARDIKIYNNVFYNTKTGVYDYADSETTYNIDIQNNIFSSLTGFDIDNRTNPSNWTANNNLYDNGQNNRNIVDNNSVTGNPMFVNPSAADFHLELSSPAIDSASAITSIIKDYDNNPRPMDGNDDGTALYDIGPFEYTGTYIPPVTDNIAPSAPFNLTITAIF